MHTPVLGVGQRRRCMADNVLAVLTALISIFPIDEDLLFSQTNFRCLSERRYWFQREKQVVCEGGKRSGSGEVSCRSSVTTSTFEL